MSSNCPFRVQNDGSSVEVCDGVAGQGRNEDLDVCSYQGVAGGENISINYWCSPRKIIVEGGTNSIRRPVLKDGKGFKPKLCMKEKLCLAYDFTNSQAFSVCPGISI